MTLKEVMWKYINTELIDNKLHTIISIPANEFFKLNDVEVMQLYCYMCSYNEGEKVAIRFNPDIEEEMKNKFGYIYEHKDIYVLLMSNEYNKDFVTIK